MVPASARAALRWLLLFLAVAPRALAGSAAPPVPRRIASLNLAGDEILVDLVAVDRLVAVTAFVDDPELSNAVGRVPSSVARVTHAQLERLVELRPDLVVVSDFTDADFLHLLTASGIRYHRLVGLGSLAGVRRGILDLADAVGEPAKGAALVKTFDDRIHSLDVRLKGIDRPRVIWWTDPDTAGTGTLLDDIITHAGGTNVGALLGVTGVRPVGAERTLAADPDVFLLPSGPDAAKLRAHPVLSKSRAVRAGRIVELPGALLATITHHAAESCWALAHALHPEKVPESRPR